VYVDGVLAMVTLIENIYVSIVKVNAAIRIDTTSIEEVVDL